MSKTKKKPQSKVLSSILSRFSRKNKIVPNRDDEFRKRARLTVKKKPKSRSPEITKAKWLTSIGKYSPSDLNESTHAKYPSAELLDMNNVINNELPEAYDYINDAEYPPKQENILHRIIKKIRRPKIVPSRRPEYQRILPTTEKGGKYQRKTLKKYSR